MVAESNVNERHDMIIACSTDRDWGSSSDARNVWKRKENG